MRLPDRHCRDRGADPNRQLSGLQDKAGMTCAGNFTGFYKSTVDLQECAGYTGFVSDLHRFTAPQR
jgi:tryptophanyl-tRNA synthetase